MTEPKLHKCDQPECTFTHKSVASLGVHKRFVHNIEGTKNHNKKYYQKKKNQEKLKNAEITATANNEVVKAGYEAASNKRRSKESDFLVLVTIGRIQALCEATAERHQISKESFTKRCAELFHASTLW
jgi:hypothetical protein